MGNQKINLAVWQPKMPVYPPEDVLDNSTISEYGACPRKGFYRYGMRRGFDGKSWAIQFGLAYHKYREEVEDRMKEAGVRELTDDIHIASIDAALEGWEDPPMEDKKAYLDRLRFYHTCEQAKKRIREEIKDGSLEVVRSEDSFDLELPFWVCRDCGFAELEQDRDLGDCCGNCASDNVFRARHGGRIDQFIKDIARKGVDMVKDFKTTSYKPHNYEDKFDPSNQFFGYTWARAELSGQKCDGAIIETVHNTKTIGPAHSQHYVSYSEGQIEAWTVEQMTERQIIMTMWSRLPELGYLAFPKRTQECSSWGGCPFRGACRGGSAFEIEAWLEARTIESHWDFTDPNEEAGL